MDEYCYQCTSHVSYYADIMLNGFNGGSLIQIHPFIILCAGPAVPCPLLSIY